MRLLAVCAAALALALSACGGSGRPPAAAAPGPARMTSEGPPVALARPDALLALEASALPAAAPRAQRVASRACAAGEARLLRGSRRAYAAIARGRIEARARPGGRVVHRFGRLNANGFPTVFGVLAELVDERCEPAWYRVQLPVRPNGAVGYVRAGDVELAAVTTRLVVDLSARRLELFRSGERVLVARVAVGAPSTPTPTGTYYVNQRLVAPDPYGPFGPAALGISAFSPVLQDWIQGGPIAVHGTNAPSSIGRAVSHGCIRVDNATLRYLFRVVPAGTPVEIRA